VKIKVAKTLKYMSLNKLKSGFAEMVRVIKQQSNFYRPSGIIV